MAIITTHGLYSFTIFTYNQLQWSAGAWGGFPQVVSESNIGVTGQFIFRTTGRINDVQCNTTQDLQASPCRGSMHGGYELRLFGICFTDNSYIIEVDGQEVTNCTRLLGETYFLSFMSEPNVELTLSNHGQHDSKVELYSS
ncbi:unnamed protein product [Rotaria magnacalcarata]